MQEVEGWWTAAFWGAVGCCAGVAAGLGQGRRVGWKAGLAEGKAAKVLELQRSARLSGRCPICGPAKGAANVTGQARSAHGGLLSRGLTVIKMHGLGNSYVFIDLLAEEKAVSLSPGGEPADWGRLARAVARPDTGIGSDGLILIEPGRQAPVAMRIFNADGSEGEMCGNGIRCLAMYVYELGRVPRAFEVETRAGLRRVEVLQQPERGYATVRVDMGRPHEVGPGGVALGQALSVEAAGVPWEVWPVSVGNPHGVLFVPDVRQAPVRELGPALEHHEAFPGRINVEFCEVLSSERLRMRVWERGSGETRACGTGACAALVAASISGRAGRRAVVELPGGLLEVEWADDGHIWMTGPAQRVASGHLEEGWVRAALEGDEP